MARRSKMTLVFYALVALIVAGAIAFFMGPRTPVNTKIVFNGAAIGDDIDAYLARQEEKFDDIRSGLQKQIVWAYPNSKAKTPLSIVYVHGFSASSGEVRPLPDIIAANLGANLYYTRLQGHGRTGDAMGEATVQGWLNDIAEAIDLGCCQTQTGCRCGWCGEHFAELRRAGVWSFNADDALGQATRRTDRWKTIRV